MTAAVGHLATARVRGAAICDPGAGGPDPLGEEVAAWAARTLAGTGLGGGGLYLATLDAGAHEAVAFWRDSLETGLAFAVPGAFPWTLASSPAGRIAAELGLRGPTFTLVGRGGALAAALRHALADLSAGRVATALVAALDAAAPPGPLVAAVELGDGRLRSTVEPAHRSAQDPGPGGRGREAGGGGDEAAAPPAVAGAGPVPTGEPGGATVRACAHPPADAALRDGAPGGLLAAALRTLARGRSAAVGSDRDGWVVLEPA